MTNVEIKKELYKQKPEANFMFIRKGVAYYQTEINGEQINFEVPSSDMGDADFFPTMAAQHLNRWIVNMNTEEK